MRMMLDAAYPPSPVDGFEVIAGYLGGDTPHVWTASEWTLRPERWRLGIWTRSDPSGAAQGTAEGLEAARLWKALGAPLGTALALDFETAVNPQYVAAFDAAVVGQGYRTLLYGSSSTLFFNPKPSAGYWVADITNQPHLWPISVATQYEFDAAYDRSVVADSLALWEIDMPLTDADATLVANKLLDTLIPRQGSGETGNASLRGVLGWTDHNVAAILGAVNGLSVAPVDVNALANALTPLIVPAVLKELSKDTASG